MLLSGIVENNYKKTTSGFVSGLCEIKSYELNYKDFNINGNKLYFELPKDHFAPIFHTVDINNEYISPVKITQTNKFVGIYAEYIRTLLNNNIFNYAFPTYYFYIEKIRNVIINGINPNTGEIINELIVDMSQYFYNSINDNTQNYFTINNTNINYVSFLSQLEYILKNDSSIKDKNVSLGFLYRKHDTKPLNKLIIDAITNSTWVPNEQITFKEYLENILTDAGLLQYINEITSRLSKEQLNQLNGPILHYNSEADTQLKTEYDKFMEQMKNEYNMYLNILNQVGDTQGILALQTMYQQFLGDTSEVEELLFGQKLSENKNALNGIILEAIQNITRYIWRYIPDEENPYILYNEQFYLLDTSSIYCELKNDKVEFPVTTAQTNDIKLKIMWDF